MVVRIELILLSTAVISRTYCMHHQGYWMLSEAVANVCDLPDSRRQSLNASCDFETSQCTAGFTSPMSNYWILKKGFIGNLLVGDHSRNSSGSYYLFNAVNYFPRGDQHRDQLKLPLVLNNNICLRFWYNLVSLKSNLKVIVNGHTMFNQGNIITHGWVHKYLFITYGTPVQIIFESTKMATSGFVGIDDVVVEIEKNSSTTKGLGSTRLSSKSFTSSSTARKSTHTTPNRAITLTSLITARTARTPTSRAHTFTNLLHTTKHTMRTTALVTSIGTHKAITGNNKTSISTKYQRTTARQTTTTAKTRSAITSRRTASTAVHLSTTAHRTIVSTTTAKIPLFVSVTTAATKLSLKPIPTANTTTTYVSTTPIILTSGRLSKISQSTTVATSPSSVRNYSTPVSTRQPVFTYFMTTATQLASKTTMTIKPSATHKSMAPKYTSLVVPSKPSISKSDPVNNITSPKSTISNNKSTTSAANRRTTRRKTDSAIILVSATTTKKNVSRTLSTTADRSSVSTTTGKTPSIINSTTATSKPPFKTTHTTKTTTTYVSTTPVRFTFGRLSTIANSTTSATSLSSVRHMSASVPTRQPTVIYWMTTTPKSSFASTPTTKPTTINTSNTYNVVNLVNTSISNIRNTVHVTHIRTPKSTNTNNTSITSVTTQSTTYRKPAAQTTPLSATSAVKTVSKTAHVSATAHRISASSTITKSPSFISAMTSSVQSPTAKFTTSNSSTLPIISTFDRSTAMLTKSLAPSFVIKFATSIPTRKPSFTYVMTTGTKSSLANSPTTNSTTTSISTVTKLISWVRTRTSTSGKPDHVTSTHTPKTTKITNTSSTSVPIPRTDHISNVSTSTSISSSSTKETTSTIVPLSAITHKTNSTLTVISKSKLQSTNTSSTNSPTTNSITTRKSTVTELITWVRTRTSTSDKRDHVTNKHTPKTTNITITSSTSAPIPRTDHISNVSISTSISSSSTKETTSTIVPLSVMTHKTNPTVAAVSKSKLQSTNTSSVSVYVTFFSNAALALSTTKRPVISSIVSPIFGPDTSVPTTTSTPGNTILTSISQIIPSSLTRNRTNISTDVPSMGATGKFASSTKPLLETVSRTFVSTTASKSVNEPNTTMSTIVSIAADTQRPKVETFAPTSTALPKMSSSTTTTKLALVLNSSRSTISTSSKSFITTSMNTSAYPNVNSFKTMLLSAIQTDPSISSFTECKCKSVTTSASNYQDIKSSASTQPDAIARTEPRSPAASEIFKVTFNSSRTMKTTTTSPVKNTATSPVENTTTSLVENNTHINVQISSFTQKKVKSTVTTSTLFKTISQGKMGRFDKHQVSSGGSSGKETLITAILCSLAGMLLLLIVFVIILRRKNGRSPFAVMATRLNVKLFEKPNDGSDTVLMQLRELNN